MERGGCEYSLDASRRISKPKISHLSSIIGYYHQLRQSSARTRALCSLALYRSNRTCGRAEMTVPSGLEKTPGLE